MNRKQLTLLIVVGVALGGLGWLAYQKQQTSFTESSTRMGAKLIPNFPLNDVGQITIKQPEAELNLAKKNEVWTVVERGNYPANFANISDLLRKFWELKVAKPVKVGPSRLPALELVPPDKGKGTLVDFKDNSGKSIQSVLLGAKHMREGGGGDPQFGGGGSFPDGRYVMVGSDASAIALVSEPFSTAEAKPGDWLEKEWFKVEKLKSVAVKSGEATNDWKLARETETGEWKLVDAKAGEALDTGKSGGASSALSYPSFNDVATATDPAATGLDKPIIGTLETFEGFNYTVKVGKKSGEENYHFQMAVAGNFPKERTPGKDEKPEDKEKLDKEFKDGLAKQEEKLKKEKAYENWIYIVSKWTIDPFLKARHELLATKTDETKADDAKPGAPSAAPLPSVPGLELK